MRIRNGTGNHSSAGPGGGVSRAGWGCSRGQMILQESIAILTAGTPGGALTDVKRSQRGRPQHVRTGPPRDRAALFAVQTRDTSPSIRSTMHPTRYAAAALVGAALALSGAARAAPGERPDPLSVDALAPSSPRGAVAREGAAPCGGEPAPGRPLALADVADRALCANPQTRAAWANARTQAALVGVARSAYWPTLSASAGVSRNRTDGGAAAAGGGGGAVQYTAENGALSAAFVIYDFGARSAALGTALETLRAADYTLQATVQKVFLSAVQAYYQYFASRAAVDAAREAEAATLESYRAAQARHDAGVATRADVLQAQTAHSQATLNRIQAEGGAKNAEGTLASIMGLDADRPLAYAAPAIRSPDAQFGGNLEQLIAEARRQRPDLAAAQAQVKAAEAGVDAARAAGMPTLSLTGNLGATDTSLAGPIHSQAVGITLSVPIFTGYNNTYQVRAAESRVESQLAQRDSVRLQVALDVWQAYQNLATGTQAVKSSADLVESATASESVARGRYKAGAGSIIDLVSAQSALASARLQNIQALYNWYVYKATLAQAMGRLDFGVLDASGVKP